MLGAVLARMLTDAVDEKSAGQAAVRHMTVLATTRDVDAMNGSVLIGAGMASSEAGSVTVSINNSAGDLTCGFDILLLGCDEPNVYY